MSLLPCPKLDTENPDVLHYILELRGLIADRDAKLAEAAAAKAKLQDLNSSLFKEIETARNSASNEIILWKNKAYYYEKRVLKKCKKYEELRERMDARVHELTSALALAQRSCTRA